MTEAAGLEDIGHLRCDLIEGVRPVQQRNDTVDEGTERAPRDDDLPALRGEDESLVATTGTRFDPGSEVAQETWFHSRPSFARGLRATGETSLGAEVFYPRADVYSAGASIGLLFRG